MHTFKSVSSSFATGRRATGRISTPTVIPNNTYWFSSFENTAAEFGSILSDGATISTWKDKSGAAHDLNKAGNAGVKPVYKTNIQNGAGAVYFNGGNRSLNVNPISFMQSQSAFTLFVVAKPSSFVDGMALTCTDTDGYKIFYTSGHWAVTAANGTGIGAGSNSTKTSVFTLIYDGTKTGNANRLKFRVNKTDQSLNFGVTTVGATTSASASYFYAGRNSDDTARYNGYLMEIVLYSTALTPSNVSDVENYFINRWQIV